MPSTEYFGNTLVNLGPLTTTFTAAPSCTADPLNYYVQDPDIDFLRYRPGCDIPKPQEGCAPSASKSEEIASSYFEGKFQSEYIGYVEYYAPASICPKGWTTVGTAASASSGAEVKATGVLNVGDWPPKEAQDLPALALDFARQANRWLEPGETIVWCCPQDYNADQEGRCWSTIGSYNPKAKGQEMLSTIYECDVPATYTKKVDVVTVTSFDGTTWDPPILSWTNYEPVIGTPISPLTDKGPWHKVVVATPVLMLIKGGDGDNDGGDDGDGDNDDDDDGASSGDDKKEENNDEEDAAMALDPKGGVVSLGVMAVALMAGAGVFTLW